MKAVRHTYKSVGAEIPSPVIAKKMELKLFIIF